MNPKEIHVLIPSIYEYIISHGKRNFADVIKLRVLRWEIILDYLSGPSIITKVLIRGRQEVSMRGRET